LEISLGRYQIEIEASHISGEWFWKSIGVEPAILSRQIEDDKASFEVHMAKRGRPRTYGVKPGRMFVRDLFVRCAF
jgi:hypothetical protein